MVTGAGHCHGAAAAEAEACGDCDDGQPLHLHHHLPTQQPRQKWTSQGPNPLQTLLVQSGSQRGLLEPQAADSGPSEQSHLSG